MENNSENSKVLNEEIVNNFLGRTLGIQDWQSKVRENKLNFLKEFVLAHAIHVGFQNAKWCAIPKAQRDMPTIGDVIRTGVLGMGGMCIHINYFIKLILEYLDFDVFIVGGETPLWSTPRSHMVTIVRFKANELVDSDSDQIYLVDLGFGGRPFMEPVPLHNLPYHGKTGGFSFEYRFNEERKLYERVSHDGCPLRGEIGGDFKGGEDFHFDLTPLTFNDFADCFEDIFSCRGTSVFMDCLYLSRVTVAKSLQDFEYVCCRNIVLIEGTRDTYKETTYESYEAMLPAIKKYFPNLIENELRAAFHTYNRAREKRLKEKEIELLKGQNAS